MAQPTNVTPRGRISGPWYGTLTVSTGTKAGTTWAPIGPVAANHIAVDAEFSGTTGNVKLQGCLTTGSTATPATLAQRSFAQRGTVVQSTVATVVAFVRLVSTSIQAGKTITVTYGASV